MQSLILGIFLGLSLLERIAEYWLARINRLYYLDPVRQRHAAQVLKISDDDMRKTLAYAGDKYRFGTTFAWIDFVISMAFLAFGGLGVIEDVAIALIGPDGNGISYGLVFFGLLGLLNMIVSLPRRWLFTFGIEARHGFNRQTQKGFWLDVVKQAVLSVLLGAPLLALILWFMQSSGQWWWLYAWGAMIGFSLVLMWLYPTVLAPMFNKFTALGEGELRERIFTLAERIGFRTSGIYIMDASKRSSHGNAYFTGVFGAKRIVLFDTLVQDLSPSQVVAVLAHELGHFKLHHVRWQVLISMMTTGVMFYALSLCMPLQDFYFAFDLDGASYYGALIVFSLWFGLVNFITQPLTSALSRRFEFAADRFAKNALDGNSIDLAKGLLKLRETSRSMPVTHPLFSLVYYSHPPMLERLEAMGVTGKLD